MLSPAEASIQTCLLHDTRSERPLRVESDRSAVIPRQAAARILTPSRARAYARVGNGRSPGNQAAGS